MVAFRLCLYVRYSFYAFDAAETLCFPVVRPAVRPSIAHPVTYLFSVYHVGHLSFFVACHFMPYYSSRFNGALHQTLQIGTQQQQGRRQGFESGGYNSRAKRAEIFFVPPTFCSLGVQLGTKHGKSSQILLRDSHANSNV